MNKRSFVQEDDKGVSPVIATILMVGITVVLAAVLYIMVIGLAVTPEGHTTGNWGIVKATSNTTALASFAGFSDPPVPTSLRVVLSTPTQSGTYFFPSNEDGVTLVKESGDDTGTFVYRDYGTNEKVNGGDELWISDLSPGTFYTLKMLSGEGQVLHTKVFTTPS